MDSVMLPENKTENSVNYHLLMVFTFLFPYLRCRDVLSCRVTCRTWRKIVDDFLVTCKWDYLCSPTVRDLTYGFFREESEPFNLFCPFRVLFQQNGKCRFQNNKLVQYALQNVNEMCFAPFTLTRLSIMIDPHISSPNTSCSDLEEFLTAIGMRIRHLYINVVEFDLGNVDSILKTLTMSLQKCQNLLLLHLILNDPWDTPNKVHQQVSTHSWPEILFRPLNQLKFLRVQANLFERALICKHAKQLVSLNVSHFHSCLHCCGYDNLKELEINFEYAGEEMEPHEILKSLCRANPRLEALTFMNYDLVNLDKRIETAEHFAESLQSIAFHTTYSGLLYKNNISVMKLPVLNKLSLEAYSGSLDFLSQLTSLSIFNFISGDIEWLLVRVADRTENVEIYKHMENDAGIYHSNVWALLPKLKELQVWKRNIGRENVKHAKYTRTGYEYFHRYDVGRLLQGIQLSHLPLEMWEMVVQKIDDSNDLHNMYLSCSEGHHMLKPTRSSWLFPLVFRFIAPHLISSWGAQAIYNCRLVCSQWQKGVDSFYEMHESRLPDSQRRFWDISLPLEIIDKLSQYNLQEIYRTNREQFMKMQNHPRNPFIGRSIKIVDAHPYQPNRRFLKRSERGPRNEHVENRRRENEDTLNFLQAVGHHVRHCTLTVATFRTNSLQFLSDCLFYLPNLLSLRVVEIDTSGEQRRSVANTATSNPEMLDLPALKNLVSFAFVDRQCRESSTPRISQIVHTYANQIRKLELTGWRTEYSASLVNLEEFHIRTYLHGQLPSNTKLRKFRLDLDPSPEDIGKIPSLAGHFGETLKELIISSTRSDRPDHGAHVIPMIDIPCPFIESLKFIGFKPICLDFLMKLHDIKSLFILSPMKVGEIVQIFGGKEWPQPLENRLIDIYNDADTDVRNDMSYSMRRALRESKITNSNIWDFLPKLRTVVCDKYESNCQHYHFYYRGQQWHDCHRINLDVEGVLFLDFPTGVLYDET